MGVDIRRFMNEERGISDETLEAFGVVFEGDDTLHLPYTSGIKGRRLDSEGKRHFFFVEGNASGLFLSPSFGQSEISFLVEGETDAMRLWQELRRGGSDADVAGIGGINNWRPELAEYFSPATRVWTVLDNDADYNVRAVVDKSWSDIRTDLGMRAMRVRLPDKPMVIKDLCEFFEMGFEIDDLRKLCERAQSGDLHYDALDLLAGPEETDWLVEGILARGDVALVVGEPGVGKSWLSMDLANKIAGHGGKWLGHNVLKNGGKVLYVDEENPRDVVRHRLRLLGFDASTASNIRYLHQQGIRLDRRPEQLLDEAIAFQPDLIVLDSLTRLHTQEENNAGAMASLFNDGINPLARQTNSGLLLLHHANKSDSSSSFIRTRGSSDISASVDTGLDVRHSETSGRLTITHFKSRRSEAGKFVQAAIARSPSGGVEIQTKTGFVF